MFPDCPAQPANILRARYPHSRAGERKPARPRGLQLTLADEQLLQAPLGSPPAPRVSPARRGPQPRGAGLARAEQSRLLPSRLGEKLREASSSAGLGLFDLKRLRCKTPCLGWPECRKCHEWLGGRDHYGSPFIFPAVSWSQVRVRVCIWNARAFCSRSLSPGSLFFWCHWASEVSACLKARHRFTLRGWTGCARLQA